jgi:hypothetical protein
MALPEPNNALYAAVKAIANPWPPDDEDVAHQLATAWQAVGSAAARAGGQAANSQQAVGSSWQDQAGQDMAGGLDGVVRSTGNVSQAATDLAGRADRYAQVLTRVKNAITQTVDQALPAFLQAGSPTLPNGPAFQQQIVNQVAARLTAMVRAAAGQLGGAPPPRTEQEDKTDEALDIASKGFNDVSAVAGFLALFPPLTAVALPVAAATGVVGLIVDAVRAGKAHGQDTSKNIGVGVDALGLVPGVKSVFALRDGVEAARTLGAIGATTNLVGASTALSDNNTADNVGTGISGVGNLVSGIDAFSKVKP